MDIAKIDRLAYTGADTPDGLDYAETLRFLMLRALYDYARQVNMPSERGKVEKKKIEAAVKSCQADRKLAKYHADILRDTGAERVAYRQARHAGDTTAAIEAADRIVSLLDNVAIESREK